MSCCGATIAAVHNTKARAPCQVVKVRISVCPGGPQWGRKRRITAPKKAVCPAIGACLGSACGAQSRAMKAPGSRIAVHTQALSRWVFVILMQLAVTAPAWPQQPGDAPGTEVQGSNPLEIDTLVEQLVTDLATSTTSFRRLGVESRLSEGDEVQYSIRLRNPGPEQVTDIVVTKRLPTGLRYKPGTAVGPGCVIQVSRDGGERFLSEGADGRSRPEAAAYSHVRWVLAGPLAPEAVLILRFRAIFN